MLTRSELNSLLVSPPLEGHLSFGGFIPRFLQPGLTMPRRSSESIGLTPGFCEGNGFAPHGLPAELRADPLRESQVPAALCLIASGVPEEEAARSLTWKDFEGFCAQLLRASGYAVRENVHLSRPRAQIDLVATGPLSILNLDCKHWKRAPSPSALEGFALAQLRRSRLLRKSLDDPKPIISVILSFSESAGGFVQGVAVVPLRTLRDFLETVESYSALLQLL